MVKMIVTDLDGTLLRSDKRISEHSISVLKMCQSKGIKIVFATARSAQASAGILEQFMPDIFIGYGGALVSEGGKVICRYAVPAEISAGIIQECLRSQKITSILATNESTALTNNPLELEAPDSSHYMYSDFSECSHFSFLKISVVSASPDIVEAIASRYPMCDMLRYTGEDLYRFASIHALKWNALKAAAEYYNISTDRIIAFGDDINDLEMIRNCGTGVAVGNAAGDVKKAARYICGTNDNDGAAKWLEEHILT